jgi:hypothetical protein
VHDPSHKAGYLSVWINYNSTTSTAASSDSDWADSGERLFADLPTTVGSGTNWSVVQTPDGYVYTLTVKPVWNAPTGQTVMRFEG